MQSDSGSSALQNGSWHTLATGLIIGLSFFMKASFSTYGLQLLMTVHTLFECFLVVGLKRVKRGAPWTTPPF